MPGFIVDPESVTGEWEDPIVDGRTTLARQVDDHEQRLAALEAPDAEQVSDLQLRLAVEYDGRVAAEAKLSEIRAVADVMGNSGSDVGVLGHLHDLFCILDGEA